MPAEEHGNAVLNRAADIRGEAVTDGEDYIEGNAGNDTLYGGMGQDDLVGGSSSLFGAAERADGSDLIYGGDGADVIVGDNGNIYRIVDAQVAYDPTLRVRAAELLDYAIGAADEIHGDGGEDAIYGQRGDDALHGDAGDDDLIGGQGNDAIWGGAGRDGILGDDGRIFTSRNGTAEPLYGILQALEALNLLARKIGVANIVQFDNKNAHLQQVILGNTLEAITRLQQAGALTHQESTILEENYSFLRTLEHRLQIMYDLQTHTLPDDGAELQKIAIRMGFVDGPGRSATGRARR